MKKKCINLFIFMLVFSLFIVTGCTNKKEYTKFQNAYFEISSKAENKDTFNKDNLEKIVGSKSNKAKDINTYIFESNGESLMIGLNDDSKLDIIKYEKNDEITLVNCLVDNTNIGGYTKGYTSKFKVNNLEKQKKEFNTFSSN